MERKTNTGIFANSVGISGRRIYANKAGVFYHLKDRTFETEADISEREFRYNPDDWFIPDGHHFELNGKKLYFGTIYSSYNNGTDYPQGMTGWGLIINPKESDWVLEPTITDMQKAINLITLLLDNDLLTYRNLLFAAEKVSKIIDAEIPAYSTLSDFEKLLYNNKNKLLSRLDANFIQSISDCNEMLFQLNMQFEVGSLSFKNREYTILPEYKKQHRLLNIFRSYIYPVILSKPFAEWLQNERPLIYKVDFDPNWVTVIYEVMSRYVEMSNNNLKLSVQILQQLDIVVPTDPIVVNDPDPETEYPEDENPPVEPPAETKTNSSGGALVKLLSFGFLISKFIW